MGVSPLAVLQRELTQEALPPRTPPSMLGKPQGGTVCIPRFQKTFGDRIELFAAIELRARCSTSLNLAKRMKDAPLDACAGPQGAYRFRESRTVVRHGHQGRSDACHQRRPRIAAFALSGVPGENGLFGTGNQDDEVSRKPDPVQERDVMDFSRIGSKRPYPPKPQSLSSEGCRRTLHVRLGLLG